MRLIFKVYYVDYVQRGGLTTDGIFFLNCSCNNWSRKCSHPRQNKRHEKGTFTAERPFDP